MEYKEVYDSMKKQISTKMIQRLSDGAFVPNDPNNSDWQKYQDWLKEGNAPVKVVIPTQQS